MDRQLIFASCGQFTKEGRAIRMLLDAASRTLMDTPVNLAHSDAHRM